ncbi:MAG: transglycosylase domain-containing protein [Clostridia bacterium]|nr:transglycosylase domain-containing protein [Clostridia bacterium]
MLRQRNRTKKRFPLLWCLMSAVLLLALAVTLSAGLYVDMRFEKELPQELLAVSPIRRSPRFFAYRFEDRANRVGAAYEVTDTVFAQRQSAYVPYSEIPTALINAFVAIEDKRFFEHEGVDWYRTVAAGANYLLGFSDRFGASTITQQLVKNMTGADEISPQRKLQEMLYARDLERRLDKTEIMELYLNVISFSDQCTGVGAAAEHYFSKQVCELTVAECATVAAITNNPTYYNPIRYPEHNLSRRNLILSEMYAQGYLSQAEYEEAKATPLALHVDDVSNSDGINPWYTDMVIEDVIRDLMREYSMSRAAATHLFYTGGLQIDMAIDEEIQSIVEQYYREKIRMPQNAAGESAQSALIVIDSRTGDILGVAGAVGEKKGNRLQNFATQTLRPPGSTIKPISVYAPALEKGIIDWGSVYDDVPTDFDANGRTAWPKNANGLYRGLTGIPYAVAHSTNTVAVRVLEDVGLQESFHYAKERFHLSSLSAEKGKSDCDVAALALGQLQHGVTLRELTTAYTAFADGGVYHPYRSYYRVTDADGRVLLACPDSSETVLSQENAAIMTKLLQGVITEGTSSSVTLQNLTECAGKTGTTNRDCDRWFVGYTPDLICGVWCGYEYPEPMEGKNLSTGIWNAVMREIVLQTDGHRHFEVPSTLVRVSYCVDSGRLPTDACRADARGDRCATGWFVRGKEPQTFCDCHVLCTYDVENGGVSHGFCPEDCTKQISLLRVERHFPKEIYVEDSAYVWRGDPCRMEANPNTAQAYFAKELEDYCGISRRKEPFNRSCTAHPAPETEPREEVPLRVPWSDGSDE